MADHATTGPRLPIEVIERIIDFIHDLRHDLLAVQDQYPAWRACALVSRAMRPRSQYWLFRRIWLSSKDQVQKLKQILQKNKSVARDVQVLILERSPTNYSWVSWDPLVFAPLMVNLLELRLHGKVFTNAHPRLFHAITAFKSIRRLTFYEVAFSRFGQCTDLIHAFPNLRHVDFHHFSWKPDPVHLQLLGGDIQHSPTRRRIHISHLDLGGFPPEARQICQWLSAVGNTKDLRTFDGWYDTFEALMEHEPSHLRSMYLTGNHDTSRADLLEFEQRESERGGS